jgi:hypothetical protein
MEPMQQSEEAVVAEAQKLKDAQNLKVDVSPDKAGAIVKPPAPSASADQPWQEWVQVATEFLSKLPDYVGDFFSSYQKPLDAINDVPLLAPIFELVGIGYTAWFVNRYLLKVETRKELANEFQALRGQVVGKDEV